MKFWGPLVVTGSPIALTLALILVIVLALSLALVPASNPIPSPCTNKEYNDRCTYQEDPVI